MAKDLREALPVEIELGAPVHIQGDRAIYHLGRGVHVVGPAPTGPTVEQIAKDVEKGRG